MRLFLKKNFWIMLFFDVALLVLCYLGAYFFRYEGRLESVMPLIVSTLPPLLICKVFSFFFCDLYRGMWRYTGIMDLINVIKGSLLGSLLFTLYLAMVYHFIGISRSIVFVDLIFTVVAIGGIRLFIRVYHQQDPDFFDEIMFWRKYQRDRRNVLIIGVGPLAERLFREIHGVRAESYCVVGFIEESLIHRGMKIHGVPVLGSIEDVPVLLNSYEVHDIMIADPDIMSESMKTLIALSAGHGVRVKVIPSLTKRIQGAVAQHLRDIRIEDLLERDPVKLDLQEVSKEIHDKVVMVTGAGGSIGSELARQISRFHPKKIVLLDNAETPLYHIEMELRGKVENMEVITCIGDIRNSRGLEQIFRKFHPSIIFHAAAYKHVPMMESSPLDAINTNILGTFKLASLSTRYHVDKFVMISTDKAVRPTSVMGATKRVAEMVIQAMSGNGTRFITVRFGNVLGSNGSVVPLFEKQIAAGGPITVTHPEVTRYFMTIPEAVMLVLQAAAIGKGG